jgi:hypothetical protein
MKMRNKFIENKSIVLLSRTLLRARELIFYSALRNVIFVRNVPQPFAREWLRKIISKKKKCFALSESRR